MHRLLAILLVAIVRGSVGVIVRLDSVPTVVNDPLWHLSVDRDASHDGDAETEAGFLRRLRFEVPTLRYNATPTSNALLAGGQTNNSGTTEYINGTASRLVVTYTGTDASDGTYRAQACAGGMGGRVPALGTAAFRGALGDASSGYLGLRYIATFGSRAVARVANRNRVHAGTGDMNHGARRHDAAAARDARLQQRIRVAHGLAHACTRPPVRPGDCRTA